MEAKSLLFILFGAFIILLAFTLIFGSKYSNEGKISVLDKPRTCMDDCGNDNVCIERCRTALANQAATSGDLRKCDELGGGRQDCVEKLKFNDALGSNDAGLCSGLSFEENCRNIVLYNKALTTGDKSLCLEIIDEAMKGACDGI